MKKKAFTLLEILIVIFLITLITGAIGYNMKGTLDKGRAFRTEQAQIELYDLLMLAVSDGGRIGDVCKYPERALERLGLAKDPQKLTQDGWGHQFVITHDKDEIYIQSAALDAYKKAHQ